MKKDEIVKTLKEYFERREDVSMAFLFGSFFRGVEGQKSDIDVALYFKDEKDKMNVWCDLERLLKKEVDVIVLNNAFPIIAWEAIRGIPLVIKDREKYLDYLLSVSWEAEDLLDFNLDAFRMKEELQNVAR